MHPKKPLLAIAGAEGFIIIWDYIKKGDPIIYQFESYTKDNKTTDIKKGG